MLNLIQKIHALLVSEKVNIWHFPEKKSGFKFYYWLLDEPDNQAGYGFHTLNVMIEEAYKHIDPLNKPLPLIYPMPKKFLPK